MKSRSVIRIIFLCFASVWLVTAVYHVYKPLPAGLNLAGAEHPVAQVSFLTDITYGHAGEPESRYIEQEIFDGVLDMVANARQFILVDMFLFNDFQGAVSEDHRALSAELTQALIDQKQRYPEINIHVISDPLNTVYGGQTSEHFQRLEAANIDVTLTRLARLRDSNPAYSGLWRLVFQQFGNSEANTAPNPFGDGRVSIRSYLALLNFKANHRKLIISDQHESSELVALVTSANPHDGSSAHGNVALRFTGPAVLDLLESEKAVLGFSGGPEVILNVPSPESTPEPTPTNTTLQVVTERAVEQALVDIIDAAQPSENLDLAVFYLSDRHVISALKRATTRGVIVRVLLDPNKDAFGREKNGVPNRPVGHELAQVGVTVRWCATQGEQCHAKWLMHRSATGQATMLLGSTNFTRRNLHNLNLETSVILRGSVTEQALHEGVEWFDDQWHNRDGRVFSADYEVFADSSVKRRLLYRFMEATGLSTF
ncbi:MAG: phospholipase D-like domain-containing protein [Aliidiomarina sp.]|uniref:phospholipase D-like domain-containing protein n=1 Tax=Aliidiomarina sp. TaxID=1872439 RepID=UPI0025BBC26D|nr:phospholipase D-like domain-containing protein [Aliidiomarina sp.]MCH8500730.1 phospholipase D-like domain-containing protein [Aliidiomarina sp.]